MTGWKSMGMGGGAGEQVVELENGQRSRRRDGGAEWVMEQKGWRSRRMGGGAGEQMEEQENGWRIRRMGGGAACGVPGNGEGLIRVIAPQKLVNPPLRAPLPTLSTPSRLQGGGAGAAWSRGPGWGCPGTDAAAGRLCTQCQGHGQRCLPASRCRPAAPLQPWPARLPLC